MSLYSCKTGAVGRKQVYCPENDDTSEKNKIVHLAFVQKGNPVTTVASLLALELLCQADIVRNVSGTSDGGVATKGKGKGKQIERVLGKTFTLTITDFDSVQNIGFWNSKEDNATDFDLYYFTDAMIWPVKETLDIDAKPAVITDDNTGFIEGNVVIKYSAKKQALPVRIGGTEVDKLNKPQSLFDASTTDWAAGTGGTANTSTLNAAEDSITVTATTGYINAVLVPAPAVDVASATLYGGSTLPAGLTLSVLADGTGATITGSTAAVGTYEVAVELANECGVGAIKAFTLVVTA